VWDCIAHTVDKSVARDVEAQLRTLEKAAKKEDVAKAASTRSNQALASTHPAG
jgi:hypothetical protein